MFLFPCNSWYNNLLFTQETYNITKISTTIDKFNDTQARGKSMMALHCMWTDACMYTCDIWTIAMYSALQKLEMIIVICAPYHGRVDLKRLWYQNNIIKEIDR